MQRLKRWQRRFAAMENTRRRHEANWRELGFHFLATSHGPLFGESQHNPKARPALYDTIGVECLRTLAAGMQGGLTSPSRPWFKLGLSNDAFLDNTAVQEWLEDTQERLYNLFQRSNFYDQMHRAYYELGGLGTGAIMVEENEEGLPWFQSLNSGSYYLAINRAGIVDTLYRKLKLNPARIMERWADTAPALIKNMYANDQLEHEFTVMHIIEPRRVYDRSRQDQLNRPYLSVYVLWEEQVILEESGYYEQPFIAARWGANYDDVYGQGPALDVLPAVKSLQQIGKALLIGLQKTIDPPLVVPASLKHVFARLSATPGAVTFADNAGPQPGIAPLYQVNMRLSEAQPMIADFREAVKNGLYYNLFLMLSSENRGQMTATEVNERNAEKMMLIGPTLERLRAELYEPLIARVFAIMERSGQIPPAPEAIAEQPLRVEFNSILALAQKAAGVKNIEELIRLLGGIAQFNPEALDKFNADLTLDVLEKMLGVDTGIIRGSEEVEQIRALRAQQQQALQQQQMAMQQGQMMVDAVAKGGGAVKDLAAAAGAMQSKAGATTPAAGGGHPSRGGE